MSNAHQIAMAITYVTPPLMLSAAARAITMGCGHNYTVQRHVCVKEKIEITNWECSRQRWESTGLRLRKLLHLVFIYFVHRTICIPLFLAILPEWSIFSGIKTILYSSLELKTVCVPTEFHSNRSGSFEAYSMQTNKETNLFSL